MYVFLGYFSPNCYEVQVNVNAYKNFYAYCIYLWRFFRSGYATGTPFKKHMHTKFLPSQIISENYCSNLADFFMSKKHIAHYSFKFILLLYHVPQTLATWSFLFQEQECWDLLLYLPSRTRQWKAIPFTYFPRYSNPSCFTSIFELFVPFCIQSNRNPCWNYLLR